MPIRVGTLVKRYEDGIGHSVCKMLNFHAEEDNSDNHLDLDVCLGVVIEVSDVILASDTGTTVSWVQRCRYHREIGEPAQGYQNPDNLWEVGQLL